MLLVNTMQRRRVDILSREPLSISQLKQMTEGRTKIKYMDYDSLSAIKKIEDLFGDGNCAIILMDIEGRFSGTVGHFIALLRYKDHIEHFDSYGLSIDEELAKTHDKPYLSKLLMPESVKFNHIQLQSHKEDINTCGRWCVARCLLYALSLSEFVHFCFQHSISPDETITLMTSLLPGEANHITHISEETKINVDEFEQDRNKRKYLS